MIHNNVDFDTESSQKLIKKGRETTAIVSISGSICNLIFAFLVQDMSSVFLTVLFFFLLYKGYDWVRKYFIVTSIIGNILLILLFIKYHTTLLSVPVRYLIAFLLLFVTSIILPAVLSNDKGIKAYIDFKTDKRDRDRAEEDF